MHTFGQSYQLQLHMVTCGCHWHCIFLATARVVVCQGRAWEPTIAIAGQFANLSSLCRETMDNKCKLCGVHHYDRSVGARCIDVIHSGVKSNVHMLAPYMGRTGWKASRNLSVPIYKISRVGPSQSALVGIFCDFPSIMPPFIRLIYPSIRPRSSPQFYSNFALHLL